MTQSDPMKQMFDFIERLETLRIAFSLKKSRPRMITILVDVPGERWEVEFGEDGDVDVEVFLSQGVVGEEKLEDLFREHSD